MFEYYGKTCVIEYQCSPIATEYVERHELYQASGIVDIWVCGTEKYLKLKMREKYLEQYGVGFYNSNTREFIVSKYSELHNFLNTLKINHRNISMQNSYDIYSSYYKYKLENAVFSKERLIEPLYFKDIDYDDSIITHNQRHKRKNDDNELEKIKAEEKIEKILGKYCNSSNGLSYVKIPCDYIYRNNRYKIIDNWNDYNESVIYFSSYQNSYDQLKVISETIKEVLDRRKYLFMVNHLEKVFKNKLHGEYSIDFTNFGTGEYIDIKYNQFTIRSVIRNLSLDMSIHDPNGYMRRNYYVFQFSDYKKYCEIILDIAKHANIIFDNNSKVRNALNRITTFTNRNWKFCYSISSFNLVEVKLYPIDNTNHDWSSIGTLKINANFDKNINIELSTEDELFEYIKSYFYKRLLRFFKTGIKSYYTEDERLIICHREVQDN